MKPEDGNHCHVHRWWSTNEASLKVRNVWGLNSGWNRKRTCKGMCRFPCLAQISCCWSRAKFGINMVDSWLCWNTNVLWLIGELFYCRSKAVHFAGDHFTIYQPFSPYIWYMCHIHCILHNLKFCIGHMWLLQAYDLLDSVRNFNRKMVGWLLIGHVLLFGVLWSMMCFGTDDPAHLHHLA